MYIYINTNICLHIYLCMTLYNTPHSMIYSQDHDLVSKSYIYVYIYICMYIHKCIYIYKYKYVCICISRYDLI